MPAFAATAPGKVILFGEHAVVYGRPAIAVPVTQVRARAAVVADPGAKQGQVWISAPDIALNAPLDALPGDHPLRLAVTAVTEQLGIERLPALRLRLSSTIPIAAGLGSGAAISVAIARTLSAFLGRPLPDADVSAIAYRVDQRHHGTPSGIDNTVITYAQPVFFIHGEPFERLEPKQPFTLVIGGTGIASPTGEVVGDVRRRWQQNPALYEACFDAIAQVARAARDCILNGSVGGLGPLMDENQRLLRALDVSSPELDRLVDAARTAGALGAKLCGGGRGGNMIALVTPEAAPAVAEALRSAGAVSTITTHIGRPE